MPYEDVRQFYHEYCLHCEAANTDRTERAQEQTFRRAFVDQPDVRLIGCKGSFHTCELCNNANELLRDPARRFTRHQREIIMQFKFIHLQQQARERETLEENKNIAAETDGDGNPKCALLFLGE